MPIYNAVLQVEVASWTGGFRRVAETDLTEAVLEALEPLWDCLPEGCETVDGLRYRWRVA